MNTQKDTLPNCRLFLMPPSGLDAAQIMDCVSAAADTGDIACLVLEADEATVKKVIKMVQEKDIAVLIHNDVRLAAYEKADGVQINSGLENAAAARKSLGQKASIGVVSTSSRHEAMQAGETDIDYLAFDISEQAGADLLEWWVPLFEVPAVAINPTDEEACIRAIEAGADFVSPPKTFWTSATDTAEMAKRLTEKGVRQPA